MINFLFRQMWRIPPDPAFYSLTEEMIGLFRKAPLFVVAHFPPRENLQGVEFFSGVGCGIALLRGCFGHVVEEARG
jgi:hypothetical protein